MRNLSLLLPIVFCIGCKTDHTNKDHYDISVGGTLEIYSSENGSARYREIVSSNQAHLKYMGWHVEEESPHNCDGCSTVYSTIFKGESAGQDTVYIMVERQDPDTTHVSRIITVSVKE